MSLTLSKGVAGGGVEVMFFVCGNEKGCNT